MCHSLERKVSSTLFAIITRVGRKNLQEKSKETV
jgi:hypothetical protein